MTEPKRIPNLAGLLKKHFFSGLLVVIPIGVIASILLWALGSLWRLHELLPESLQPENGFLLLNIAFTLGAALVVAIGISALGWASKQYLGRKALLMLADAIQHIPLIRSVYGALDQLLRALASGGGQQFHRVVYVEYPRKGAWTIAFVTGAASLPKNVSSEKHLNVYVPTTPNPTSGFYLIIPEGDVRESSLSVEEAFKTLLSLGIAQPDSKAEAPAHVR